MITLYQPAPAWGLPSMSPFCVKLETYFRMAKVEYNAAPANYLKAPKGRVPYIKIDGQLMGDTTLIIDYLKKNRGINLDRHLSPEQWAKGIAIQCLLEEHLFFAGAWIRWSSDNSWPHVREAFLKVLPPLIGKLIVEKIRKSFLGEVAIQGMGQHTRDEIIEFAKTDLTALSRLLGDQPYFLGSEPSSVDASAYGFLIQNLWVPWESPLKDHLRTIPNLDAFCNRMKERYWS